MCMRILSLYRYPLKERHSLPARDGEDLVPETVKILDEICLAIQNFDEGEVFGNVRKALDMDVDPSEIIEHGIAKGLRIVGEKFDCGELFLVHLISAAEPAQKAVRELLKPALEKKAQRVKTLGKVVLGTVQGDIHNIGKNIVGAMLFAAGFEVIDLGEDVPAENFARKAKEVGAQLVGGSALLTTTRPGQREIIEALKREGIRGQVKVIFGGAPCTPEWVREIGGDAFAGNAMEGVRVAKQLLGIVA